LNEINGTIIDKDYLDEIPVFENFFHNVGFKRNEGAIYGLLVLSESSLTSEDIEKTLNLSQSAVSQALKKLALFGAIETRESRHSEKRVKEHTAKEDSLAIVSTIFKKREQETIEEFKKMATRLLSKESHRPQQNIPRIRRLQSILSTCEIAESVMNFVITLSQMDSAPMYSDVVQNLPKLLNVLTSGTENVSGLAQNMAKKLKSNFLKFSEQTLREVHNE